MLPKNTLKRLLGVARARSDTAARTLGATHSREREETNKLELLLHYRDECLARLVQATREGIERAVWLNYQRFVLKLDAAIDQQRGLLAQQREKLEQRRSEWRAASNKLRSFDALEQRRQEAERVSGGRREQREQDEFALRTIRTR
ncbi:MAG TPA: flagellar export protein FliJ [Myxococcota bacterium]|nr:flagellar export protein FliJ [Myxococcota bacterium]